jgi:hypothetical protein
MYLHIYTYIYIQVEHMSSTVSFGDLMHSPMVNSSYKGTTTGGSNNGQDETARGKLNALSNNDYSLARLTLIRKWKGIYICIDMYICTYIMMKEVVI